jgi:2-polyprenyl-6-methoxyphenol hydroxylase-like FAD-dependent oxidoreductase
MLERFLALVVYASSSTYPGADEILVRRGIAFERFADNTIEEEDIVPSGSPSIALFRRSFVDTAHNPDALQAVPFDVIFACDGANSAVRNAAGVIAELQGTFLPFREEIGLRRDEKSIRQKQERGVRRLAQLKGTFRRTQSQSVDVESRAQEAQGLSQTTLILAFEKETRNGSLACPAYHKHMDAFAPAVADASGGITAVFKRLHSPFCEFQVLLSHKLMASLRVSGESRVPIGRIFVDQDFFPWENVLAAADLLFVRPFGSVESLRRALRPYAYHKAGDQDDQYNGSSVRATATPPRHAVLFRMGIHRASRSALVHGDGSIVVIRGDAVLSAHYRLGIGINQAFESLENEVAGIVLQWHRLFELAAAEVDQPRTRLSVLEELAERHRLRADPRVTWMSDVQLFTMFFEAYCDLIVDNSDLNDLVVLRKVRSSPGAKVAAHVSAEPLSDADVQHLPCMVQWLNFSRNNAP